MAKKKLKWEVKAGDCLKLMADIDDGAVDLAFADPPFNINYEYDKYEDKKKPEHYLDWCALWIRSIYRVLKNNGSFWLAIGDEYVSELDVLAKQIGFTKRSHVVWYYTFGVACSKNFSRSHTHLLYYTVLKSRFTFNAADKKLRVPSARQLVYNDKRGNPDGKLPDNTWVLSPLDLDKAFTPEEDTWLVSRVAGTFGERQERGTYGKNRGCPQMPLEILNRIVLACSNPGDLILDPFGGTFTTGDAAVRNRRNFIGFDISDQYCERGRERLRKAVDGRQPAKPPSRKRARGKGSQGGGPAARSGSRKRAN